ncbi:MAG: hypothetical protein HN893_12675 [Rhodospirillales bacterium]|nr:hypothetical protein [Rhodospirillales bacterium]
MKRVIPVVLGSMLLGACTLPLHVQVVSWAIDGISYLTTEKSVTDHGLSMVAQQDCALWRLLTQGDICRDEDAITAIASADVATEGQAETVGTVATEESSSSWSNPATAEDLSVIEVSVAALEAPVALEPVIETSPITSTVTPTIVVPLVEASAVEMANAGDYLVIGSFSKQTNALGFAEKNGSLDTKILPAMVSGEQVYRVVVGPVVTGNRETVTAALQVAGLNESWPLSVTYDQTTIAWRKVSISEPVQLAALSE